MLTDRLPERVTRMTGRVTGRGVAISAIVLVVLYLVIGPVLMLLFSSFRETDRSLPFESISRWSLINYEQVLLSSTTYSVLGTTMFYAVGSLAVGFAMALSLAWLVERTDIPGRGFISVMVIAALGIPGVISSIAWALLLSPRSGVINIAIQSLFNLEGPGPLDIYNIWGMIFVQGVSLVPITYLLVAAAFRASDAGVEEAGATSGATFQKVMRKITLPLLTPAILSALVYQFVSVIESFDVPLVIGLPAGVRVLSTQIFTYAAPAGGLPDFGTASAYSILLIALSLGPLLVYNRVIGQSERYATVSGHSHRSRRVSLGRARWLGFGFAFLVICATVLFPAMILFWTALQPYYAPPSLESLARIDLSIFGEVLTSPAVLSALRNTLYLATATALVTMILGLLVSWVLVRTRSKMRVILDVLAFVPHAMPGLIIAISVLLIYLYLPIPLTGTLWIMVIALSTQWLSLSSRLMTAGIAQIRNDLEEAASTSGAAWYMTMRKIVLPLVMPAFLNGLVLIFLQGIKNLTIPLILFSPRTQVLSTTVWQFWENGQTQATAAVGVAMVLITVTLAILLRKFNTKTFIETI